MEIKKVIVSGTVFILLSLFLIGPIKQSYSVSTGVTPLADDSWVEVLENIRRDRGDNYAIVTSWWDFSHLFKAIADTPVTFDGGSQNTPQAYWVGKFFVSEDERLSTGILRMLNCGGNKAFEEVNKLLSNPPDSVAFLNELALVDRWNAENLLVERLGIGYEQTESILRYTHCEAPTSYVIASGDMVLKSGVWGHFGSWDFYKAEEVFNTPKSQRIGKLSNPDNYVADWPSYSNNYGFCQRDEKLIVCDIQGQKVTVDLINKNASLGNGAMPEKTVYEDDGIRVIKSNQTNGLSVIIADNTAILAHPVQADSLFTKMYFFEGRGLECFELFDKQTRINGERIYVYKTREC